MRSELLVLSILLMTPVESSSATLQVDRASIHLLSESGAAQKCGGADHPACMAVDTQLISSCSPDGTDWHPVCLARLTPHVFTSSLTLLTHEFLHIADIGEALMKYANEIEARQFTSQEGCLSFLESSRATTIRTLRDIEEDSAHKRDPRTAASQPAPID